MTFHVASTIPAADTETGGDFRIRGTEAKVILAGVGNTVRQTCFAVVSGSTVLDVDMESIVVHDIMHRGGQTDAAVLTDLETSEINGVLLYGRLLERRGCTL